ncbi:hypothetical protein HYDPIDRAFT_116033, partial [Hydnomerulius pinastri MD-312]
MQMAYSYSVSSLLPPSSPAGIYHAFPALDSRGIRVSSPPSLARWGNWALTNSVTFGSLGPYVPRLTHVNILTSARDRKGTASLRSWATSSNDPFENISTFLSPIHRRATNFATSSCGLENLERAQEHVTRCATDNSMVLYTGNDNLTDEQCLDA